jgi:tRNA nucleotidyltransferase (CCA-adding enzyme)
MAIQNASTLTAASRQWASRPSDERFTSLLDLQDHVNTQRNRSRGKIVSSRGVTAQPDPNCPHQGLVIVAA